MDAKINDWVIIHNIVLTPEERAPQVPEDTKKVSLEKCGLKVLYKVMLL